MDGVDLDGRHDVEARLLEAQGHTASTGEKVYADRTRHTLSPEPMRCQSGNLDATARKVDRFFAANECLKAEPGDVGVDLPVRADRTRLRVDGIEAQSKQVVQIALINHPIRPTRVLRPEERPTARGVDDWPTSAGDGSCPIKVISPSLARRM